MRSSMALFTFFCFRWKTHFLSKFGPKNQNFQFKLKFGIQANSNMQNSMVVLTFSVLDRKTHFLGKFGPKNQNYQFKLKFGTQANSNMQNSMVVLTFLFQTGNTLFGKFFKKVRIVSLIRICRIQWWSSLFLFQTGNTLFGQIWSKRIKTTSLS